MNMHKKDILFCILSVMLLVSCSNDIRLYVSPDGNDTATGTLEQPLQTLEGAQKAVRAIHVAHPDKKVTVYFKGGVYPLEHALILTAEDSGREQAPVIYRAMDGETPIFTGGKALTRWAVPADTQELERLTPTVRDKVYVSDLTTAGITDFGDPINTGQRPDLVCYGQLQTLTRWPGNGFIRAGKVKGDTIRIKEGSLDYCAVYQDVTFEYLDTYQDRWAQETDICLGGYWYWDWLNAYQKVTYWDAKTRTVRIGEPFQRFGYKDGFRYFGLNLFCEINKPGDWYLNRTTGKLYWYPPEGIEPEKAEVSLTCFNEPYMLEMKDCSYVTIEGLTFREGRGSAVLIENGTHVLLSDCRIERFGTNGVLINGGTHHGATGCYLSTFGHGGFKIYGGDRKTLTPCEHFLEHTVVENITLFERTYQPAVDFEGCGVRISNNRFRNSSSSSMNLRGNDILIEYNDVSHVVNESDDQGAIDMWYDPSYRGVVIRYNRWSDIHGGTENGAAGIRFDDMISGMLVYGNLFERCGAVQFGGVQIHGGKDNCIENNVFYECRYAVSFSPWGEKRWLAHLDSEAIRQKLYRDVDINSEIYRQKYPELQNLRLNVDVNSVTDNLMISCKNMFRETGCNRIRNNTEIESNGKPIEAFCTKEELAKYGLQPIPLEKIGPTKNRWITKRLALLRNWQRSTPEQVIDFTRYDIKAQEPQVMTRQWSLMGDISF